MPPPPPTWGELTPAGKAVTAVRFVTADRVVTYPYSEIKRWAHAVGEPEMLTINAGKDVITVEGRDLAVVCAALELARLCELRPTHERSNVRPGPRVRQITVEPA